MSICETCADPSCDVSHLDALRAVAERAADAIEDLLYCKDEDGAIRKEAEAAWHALIAVLDAGKVPERDES